MLVSLITKEWVHNPTGGGLARVQTPTTRGHFEVREIVQGAEGELEAPIPEGASHPDHFIAQPVDASLELALLKALSVYQAPSLTSQRSKDNHDSRGSVLESWDLDSRCKRGSAKHSKFVYLSGNA